MDDDERKRLLWPEWSTNVNGSRYDELSDIDKEVWRKTRGQRDDTDSAVVWVKALADAVKDGSITPADAELAIKRVLG
jgi:hypothetical protein